MRKSALMTLETDKESISDLFVSSFEVFSYESSREVKREREKEKIESEIDFQYQMLERR